MKEHQTSPFAALSPQEQKEQWIWWQCQHPAESHEAVIIQPESPEKVRSAPLPQLHHGQYSAVLSRLRHAGKHTSDYHTWEGASS